METPGVLGLSGTQNGNPDWTARGSSGALVSAVALLAALAGGVAAQQREPAIEVFGLVGGYVHGNMVLSPQSFSLPPQWRPQVGGGVLAPLGKKWGVLFDATTSVVEDYWKWDGHPGAGPGDNSSRLLRVSLLPSVVRLWRRDRFSIYAGGGPGFEHDRESNLFRPIVARDDRGQPIVAQEFTKTRVSKTQVALWGFRAGAIVNLSRRVVWRSGYSYLRRYSDERPSQGVEAGIGYRF